MTEKEFAERTAAAGGRAFVVGGWTRDYLRGRTPHDKDYVVTGISKQDFGKYFPEAKLIGRAFPVFLLPIEDKQCEVAMARRERKAGQGYRGFEAEADEHITIEEDLYRRDLTINSIALELRTGELIDPYHGREDIEKKVLRPVSEHFCEDPVRALRAARFAAQLDFEPNQELIDAMGECGRELQAEPGERILGELKRALSTDKPSRFFRVLERADLLKITFPELHALIGKIQPVEFHPEGDAFEHVMNIVDEVAGHTDNIITRFAALCHDLGKGVTPPEMLPHHYGHEIKGLKVLNAWNRRIHLPVSWLRATRFIIEQHMRAPRLGKKGKILDLLLMFDKVKQDMTIDDINIIIRADHGSLPPYLENAEAVIAKLKSISGADAPKELKGKAIGEWVRAQQLKLL